MNVCSRGLTSCEGRECARASCPICLCPFVKLCGRNPNFLGYFDHVTFSCEIGVLKPEPEIYEHALRGLGVAPAEAVFLDDRPENVEGARHLGLHAELFTTWEDFREGDSWKTIGRAAG